MKEILEAIRLVKQWNLKPLNVVVKAIEAHTNKKIPEEVIKEWKYTGLNNIDFIKTQVIK